MAGESVANFSARATLDNKQFIAASRETSSRARQLARDLKELDRQARADAASRSKDGGAVDDALKWGKVVYGINAATKSLRAFNDMLESSGHWAEKLQAGLEQLPIVGGLSREGGRLGKRLFGPSDTEMLAEAERLAQENNRKLRQLAQQEKQQQKEREAAAKDAQDRRQQAIDKEAARQKSVDAIILEQYAKTQAVFQTEEERQQAKDRAVLRAAEEAGATEEEWFYLRELLKTEREREAVVKRIDDTNDHMAAVTIELQEAERKRREDFDYMIGVEKELTAEKKKQADKARELAEAGRRSAAAMEAGTSAAYSAIIRGGSRGGMGQGVETALRQIAMHTARTARNTHANRITTVDAF